MIIKKKAQRGPLQLTEKTGSHGPVFSAVLMHLNFCAEGLCALRITGCIIGDLPVIEFGTFFFQFAREQAFGGFLLRRGLFTSFFVRMTVRFC